MSSNSKLKLDEVGYWSEIKLDIVKKYAAAYSTIFSAKRQHRFHHLYIDAFSGAGLHISKNTGEFVLGSPLNALHVKPAFREYHFIDLNSKKVKELRTLVGERPDVKFYEGDCNSILLEEVFPKARYKEYRRALCLLDPYGLHLDWKVIETAGRMESIDMFLNFPIGTDINRNVLRHNFEHVRPEDIERMNSYWGDGSWKEIAYSTEEDLFGFPRKVPNEKIVIAFRERLKKIARFKYVPEPMPMRNTQGATIYYLFFASQNNNAQKIIQDIFNKYRERGT